MRQIRTRSILGLCLVLTVSFVGLSAAEPLGTAFTYQGRLIDANSAADGLYDFQFKLYDAPNDGNQVGSTIDVNECDVIAGYFTIALDFGSGVFDGNDRWLEIGVRAGELGDPTEHTTLSPRHQVTPVPYALYATTVSFPLYLRGPTGHSVISGINTHDFGTGIFGVSEGGSGIVGRSTSGYGVQGDNWNSGSYGFLGGPSYGAYGEHTGGGNWGCLGGEYEGVYGVGTDNGVYGVGTGNGVLGLSDTGTGVNGISDWGVGVGGSSDEGCGVYGTSRDDNGMTGVTWWGSSGVMGNHMSSGNWGYLGGESCGVSGYHGVSTNRGRLGGDNYGVYGYCVTGKAVWGLSTGGYSGYFEGGNFYVGGGSVGIGTTAPAYKLDVSGDIRATGTIYGTISGTISNADKVDGYHVSDLDGRYVNEGQSNSINSSMIQNGTIQFADLGQNGAASGQVVKWNGSAWVAAADLTGGGDGGLDLPYADTVSSAGSAFSVSNTGDGIGVDGTSTSGYGVWGENTDTGNVGILGDPVFDCGVFGLNGNSGNVGSLGGSYCGVRGDAGGIYDAGVQGYATGSNGPGVMGESEGIDGYGGHFTGRGAYGVGIYATGGPNGYAGEFDGNVILRSGRVTTPVLEITGGADVAEPFPISNSEEIPKGSVVVIDEDNPGQLKLSDRPYDKRVAGVVSGAGGLNPGLILSQQGIADKGIKVALSGRVYTLADASNGSIKPGDMLTTSDVPGHAMKAMDRECSYGAVIGKSMSLLQEGRGLVLVLVTLQ